MVRKRDVIYTRVVTTGIKVEKDHKKKEKDGPFRKGNLTVLQPQ